MVGRPRWRPQSSAAARPRSPAASRDRTPPSSWRLVLVSCVKTTKPSQSRAPSLQSATACPRVLGAISPFVNVGSVSGKSQGVKRMNTQSQTAAQCSYFEFCAIVKSSQVKLFFTILCICSALPDSTTPACHEGIEGGELSCEPRGVSNTQYAHGTRFLTWLDGG